MSKPNFTFVKMIGCGPCNSFFGNPDPEKSQWAQLVKDKDLAKVVNFQLAEWGMSRETQQRFKKPAHLEFINYGPAFVLVDSQDMTNKLEYDKQSPKTAASLKKWILENVGKIPLSRKMSTSSVQEMPAVKPPQAHHPVTVSPSPSAGPKSFVPVQQLPKQLQHNNVQNVQVFTGTANNSPFIQVPKPEPPQPVESAPVQAPKPEPVAPPKAPAGQPAKPKVKGLMKIISRNPRGTRRR